MTKPNGYIGDICVIGGCIYIAIGGSQFIRILCVLYLSAVQNFVRLRRTFLSTAEGLRARRESPATEANPFGIRIIQLDII